MKVILIRHGMTQGNEEKRYMGITDESLCENGIRALEENVKKGIYPSADRLFVSPMKRCMETGRLLYPALSQAVVQDFRECDFGTFEGKNYKELSDDENYRRWIQSNGTLPFPKGEEVESFKRRCQEAFRQCMESMEAFSLTDISVALVVHGGTIMAIMERYAVPQKGYYDYQVANGLGYMAEYSDGRLCDVHVLGANSGKNWVP